MSSVELDRLQNQIGHYGVVQKEAKNLAPNESMIVRGEYATSWFKLYLKQILISLTIIIAIIIGSIFLSKWWKKRRAAKNKLNKEAVAKSEEVVEKSTEKMGSKSIKMPFYRHVILGLISASLTLALIGILVAVDESNLFSILSYNSILALLAFLLVVLLFGAIIFGPVVYIGFKYGWRQGLKLFAVEFGWLVILAIIVAAFIFLSSNGSPSPRYPRYID